MAMIGRLAERVALITGGGGEIGSAIAKRFAAEGATVAVADIVLAKSEATARAVVESGGRACALQVDVADESSAKAVVNAAIKAFGRLTTLVNVAAAVTPDGTVETLSLEEWNRAIGINLTGAFLMCKYAVPHLRQAAAAASSTSRHSSAISACRCAHPIAPPRPRCCASRRSSPWITPRITSAPTRSRRASSSRSARAAALAARKRRASGWGRSICSPPWRARGDRGRRGLSRVRRCVLRHRDRYSDRRRLRCLQGQAGPERLADPGLTVFRGTFQNGTREFQLRRGNRSRSCGLE